MVLYTVSKKVNISNYAAVPSIFEYIPAYFSTFARSQQAVSAIFQSKLIFTNDIFKQYHIPELNM
jgi:hypothetical protein